MYGIGGLAGWYYDLFKDDLNDYKKYLEGIKSDEGILSAIKTGGKDAFTTG